MSFIITSGFQILIINAAGVFSNVSRPVCFLKLYFYVFFRKNLKNTQKYNFFSTYYLRRKVEVCLDLHDETIER